VALDLQRRITAFNRAAEEITGFAVGEAIGQSWETIFGTRSLLDEMAITVSHERPETRRREIRLKRKDGREVPLGISFWPLRSGEGELIGLIGVCQDLSDIKRMEERMRQTDRLAALGRLAANLAHEIRNPLAAVTGAIEQIGQDLPVDDTQKRLTEIVLKESSRLNQIVSEFLQYARPLPLRRQAVNLAELLEEVVGLLECHPLSAKVKIIREYEPELPVRVDANQLRQALWNLALNAVQAMPEGGELTMGARVLNGAGSRLFVWVADTGPGIESADLPHIFEPFYSTRPDGTGLGLAVVHRVVRDHGGEVEVKSAPGAGSTFTLLLPMPPDAAPRS
jgi:two-component system sensor histidine kinase PilS (NtrC family)